MERELETVLTPKQAVGGKFSTRLLTNTCVLGERRCRVLLDQAHSVGYYSESWGFGLGLSPRTD